MYVDYPKPITWIFVCLTKLKYVFNISLLNKIPMTSVKQHLAEDNIVKGTSK